MLPPILPVMPAPLPALPEVPLPLPVPPTIPPLRLLALPEAVSSVDAVLSVERGPLPSGMVLSVEGCVAMVVGTVVVSVGAVVTVGMVVGVVAGLEFRQPQAARVNRVRTSTDAKIQTFFI